MQQTDKTRRPLQNKKNNNNTAHDITARSFTHWKKVFFSPSFLYRSRRPSNSAHTAPNPCWLTSLFFSFERQVFSEKTTKWEEMWELIKVSKPETRSAPDLICSFAGFLFLGVFFLVRTNPDWWSHRGAHWNTALTQTQGCPLHTHRHADTRTALSPPLLPRVWRLEPPALQRKNSWTNQTRSRGGGRNTTNSAAQGALERRGGGRGGRKM